MRSVDCCLTKGGAECGKLTSSDHHRLVDRLVDCCLKFPGCVWKSLWTIVAADPGDHAMFYGTSPGNKRTRKDEPGDGGELLPFFLLHCYTKSQFLTAK